MWLVAFVPFVAFLILYWFRGSHPLHPRPSRRFRGERVSFAVAMQKEREHLDRTMPVKPRRKSKRK